LLQQFKKEANLIDNKDVEREISEGERDISDHEA
jgi:hypothetical protein